MIALIASAILPAYISTSTASTTLVSGINYLSYGNAWTESDAQLDNDFARFASDGIRHLSVRMMWSVMEPTYYADSCHLSSTALANYKRVLSAAERHGIGVNVDFWTQFGYTLGLPSWVGSSYWVIVRDGAKLNNYIRYIKAVVNALKDYSAVESWAIFNEPWFEQSSDKQAFQNAFPQIVSAIKSIDNVHIVTCRFALACTPGSGKYDASVYDMFDVFSVTVYIDPDDPNDRRYNDVWPQWDKTISDLKYRRKNFWVIEFGCTTQWKTQSEITTWYSHSLAKFQATGIVERAYAWAWQTRNPSNLDGFSIYDGSAPTPAYYELAKYPDSPYPSPSPSPSPSPTPPPTSNLLFEDSFESGSFSLWSGTTISRGETVTVSNYIPYHGYHDARFTTNGNSYGRENAYLFKNIDMKEAYARVYIRIASSRNTGSQILRDNGDRFYLLQFSDGTQSLALAGIRREAGVNKWTLTAGATSKSAPYSTSQAISTNQWYCIELHWSATQELAELFVNGVNILQITNMETDYYGNPNHVDVGIISATNVQNQLTIYADCFRLSNTYNGAES